MKATIKIITAAAIAAMLGGCASAPSTRQVKPKPVVKAAENVNVKPIGGRQGITVNKISFEEVSGENLPQTLKSRIETSKKQRGFAYEEVDGFLYIAIFSGERPTGGYDIKVVSIEDNEGKTNITVEETSPNPGADVTQAITYPYVVIKATGITPDIKILNRDGSDFTGSSNSNGKVDK